MERGCPEMKLEAVHTDSLETTSDPQVEDFGTSGGHLIGACVQGCQRGNNPAPPHIHVSGLENTLGGGRDLCLRDRPGGLRLHGPQRLHCVIDRLISSF